MRTVAADDAAAVPMVAELRAANTAVMLNARCQ